MIGSADLWKQQLASLSVTERTRKSLVKTEMSKQTTLLQSWGYQGNSFSAEEDVFGGDQDDEEMLQLAVEAEAAVESRGQATPLEDLPGFDVNAGRTWIYPINYPERAYQFSISKSCLFQNTLVVLPTGLGKTFIAAVIMYNYFRWYPQVLAYLWSHSHTHTDPFSHIPTLIMSFLRPKLCSWPRRSL